VLFSTKSFIIISLCLIERKRGREQQDSISIYVLN
jgi:hypothetical protein